MTNLIVLGDQKNKSPKKPIEFLSLISIIGRDDVDVETASSNPCGWKNIELICKNYASNLDLLFAYNDADRRSDGVLFIGRWNDGVVE